MMKLILPGAALAALVSLPLTNASAAIVTQNPGTITTIYGTGNPDTWAQVVTYTDPNGNFQLGLNTHINPNNGNENLDFSINVDPAGAGGITLASTGDVYQLLANNNAADPLNLALIGDNQYGINTTANGQGLKTTFALGSTGNNIFQNSESLNFLDAFFGLSAPAASYSLEVVGQNGAVVASDTLAVAPVPEPTTILAGALMLAPLGLGAIRKARNWKNA